MPIVKRTRGTGITKEETYHIVAGPDGLTNDEIQLFIRSMTRAMSEGIEQTLAAAESVVRRRLTKAGLPSNPGIYLHDRAGNWRVWSSVDQPPSEGGVTRRIIQIAQARGFDWDSPVGYAARIVDRIMWLRIAREKGQIDEACIESMRLGVLLAEADLKKRGDGPSRGGTKSCRERWNDEKIAKMAAEREEIRRLHAKLRAKGATQGEADRYVARKMGVGIRTVQRAKKSI